MHYTRVFNPGTLLRCDSSADAEIIVDYVKTQLHFRLMNKFRVDVDPEMPADGLPDYLTFIRWVADSTGFAMESGYVRHDFVKNAVDCLILLGAEVHSRHWNEAFQQGITRAREEKALDEATNQLREMFYQSYPLSDLT
ncbi:hypothetical protein [Pantoea rwandensis]|uniref:Uncharacterized protein n=1 Tax=Pantoea rwandensis TaxID=1076550 RepID=A0ABM5RPK3_9GAMM|nr:hypothetical protein [Pantoea rwandensis]AIR87672.1 hypothetical protein LH22_20200 [Pantoea rwandensis]